VEEASSELEPPFHPTGERSDPVAPPVLELHELEELADPTLADARRHAVGVPVEAEVLLGRQRLVQGRLLEHEADRSTDPGLVANDIVSVDDRRAGRGPEQRAQHPDRRRLAGAVGAEEAEHLTLPDLEGHALDCFQLAIAPEQASRLDHRAASRRNLYH
jgi:hypothetical protein